MRACWDADASGLVLCIFHALWAAAASSERPTRTATGQPSRPAADHWLRSVANAQHPIMSQWDPLYAKSALTFADNPGVFMMATVVLAPAQVEAFGQQGLLATAFHVVQQDGTRAVAKVGLSLGRARWAAAHLPAHHVGIVHVPVVITHRPPNGFVEDLDPTRAAVVAVHQANGRFGCSQVKRRAQRHS